MSSSKHLATLEEHLNTGAPNPNPPDTDERVLDEDTYVDALQHIITRDFYPDLYTLNKQNQHIEQYGTPGKHPTPTPIKQYKQRQHNQNIGSHNNKKASPKQPHSFEEAITPTPNLCHKASHDHAIDDIHHQHADDSMHYVNGEILSTDEQTNMKLMNLKQFHNLYTSEDNHSFSEIMYKNQLQHYAKYPWIYEQQQIADERKKYLSILSGNDAKSNHEHVKSITLIPTDTNTVSVVKPHEHKTKAERIHEENEKKYSEENALKKKVDLYKGELEFWPFKAVNKLMFHPEADREMNLKILQTLQTEHGKPLCLYKNTRLPKDFALEDTRDTKYKLTEMEQDLKGYNMIHTPHIIPGKGENDDIVQHAGTPILTWGELGGTPLAVDEDGNAIGPMFSIAKVPKKDKLIHALNKKNADKLRKKQENIRQNTSRTAEIYTPYATKQILTPSGNHIHTPLVGINTTPICRNERDKKKRKSERNRKDSMKRASSSYHKRTVDDLSPAARKLMQRNMKGMKSTLSTPLSSALRSAYACAATPPNYKKRKRHNINEDTPHLIVENTPKSKKRKTKDHDTVFKKPKYSIRTKSETKSKKRNKQANSSNITDGLL